MKKKNVFQGKGRGSYKKNLNWRLKNSSGGEMFKKRFLRRELSQKGWRVFLEGFETSKETINIKDVG